MPAYLDWVREFCLSLPHATERVQWGHDLLFCVGGKMFCVANMEPGEGQTTIAFKCTDETFAELIEIEGIIPAPYMARNKWVAFTDVNALRQPVIKDLIQQSHAMVIAKLPKKMQSELATQSTSIGVTQKAQALGKKKSPRKRKIVSKKKK
ncbi:MAG TPA: MmcQ/YjbR family DNA-binding protein [Candidatus Angelobacter sp.]|jgi:predicted DNA-binding protein (MmcQ/YjbR family)|nr:MmcQ/YjbR family DNA-binding protein [Candidatus Angelobacter sp.]